MPRGGFRVGAGRKPKALAEKLLTGSRRVGASVLQYPSAPPPNAPETFEPPKGLQPDVLAVWLELAPHAFHARTLTRGTEAAFGMLCRAVVLERRLATSALGAGGPDHRGMMQRVATAMKDFGIAPFGKPVADPAAQPEKPPSALERLLARRRG